MSRPHFWIDVGGTFTDCLMVHAGMIQACKVLSSGQLQGTWSGDHIRLEGIRLPANLLRGYRVDGTSICIEASEGNRAVPSEPLDVRVGGAVRLTGDEPAPILGIRLLSGLRLDEEVAAVDLRLGTTKGTNALLERDGADVALVTTRGFADLLTIGDQTRPELFQLDFDLPGSLAHTVVEADERISSDGVVLTPLDRTGIQENLEAAFRAGLRSLAVGLIHSWANPTHELAVEEIAREIGFTQVSVSHRISPRIRLLERTETTVLDACLGPVISDYLSQIRRELPGSTIQIMTSNGGLVPDDRVRGCDTVLSGPAGGVVGCSVIAHELGRSAILGFDMGGTSTDVCRYAGSFDMAEGIQTAGVRIRVPRLNIETVAAGGGSICWFDGTRLRVGPESAGADPGPACYGRGGLLTVTDLNVLTGRIAPEHFPFPLALERAEARRDELVAEVNVAGYAYTGETLVAGLLEVANEIMADAMREVSVHRGFDPSEHELICFGGAGGQHACDIAERIGIRRVHIPPFAGLLSAYGIGHADLRRSREKSILRPLSDVLLEDLGVWFGAMGAELADEFLAEGVELEQVGPVDPLLKVRYAGEEATIDCGQSGMREIIEEFEAAYETLYGHRRSDTYVEVASVMAQRTVRADVPEAAATSAMTKTPPKSLQIQDRGVWKDAVQWQRESIGPDTVVDGPAQIVEPHSCTWIPSGWRIQCDASGTLSAEQMEGAAGSQEATNACDPVQLSIFQHRLASIATRMGYTLQRTSVSVNVKERLDFSCAILDADGELVVNAPHIPVHLGAMGATVRALLDGVEEIKPGEVYLTNDPDCGGSHLPDLTVMTPVFDPDTGKLRFFVASRAHHAEIGGITPGSMDPFSSCLAEEGVVFRNFLLSRSGVFKERDLVNELTTGSYPSRKPADNIADLRAAVAANQLGVNELSAWIGEVGWNVMHSYLGYVRDAAEQRTRTAIAAIDDGSYRFEDSLDDGDPIQIAIEIVGDRMVVDFTGTGPVRGDSLNANPAVVRSAILYCLRCLVAQDIPLNDGTLRPVEVYLPECFLNPPGHEDPMRRAAVVGGNVELSQKVVDVFLGALGACAASQGTMNNVVLGDDSFGYYETVCGGTGAGPGFDGAGPVHSHMTNTRISDPEIFEWTCPVRVLQFSVRRGSGGAGKRVGGDGVVRELEFLAPLVVTLLTQRRTSGPFGLAGGEDGAPGRNLLVRDGQSVELPFLAREEVGPGDQLRIETPGGGGYGQRS